MAALDDDVFVKAGVVLNPATPLEAVEWVLDDIDFVLIMGVNPGFGGQSFIPSSLEKIAALSEMIKIKNSNALIQVDGGVGSSNIKALARAGIRSFVAGSAIFNTPDYKETIEGLRNIISTFLFRGLCTERRSHMR
ncbi:MAG: hypothetical protein HQK66_13485 [Desulfamplus sp.]|nr:hypothetical protein [Desulfamplus sp.]